MPTADHEITEELTEEEIQARLDRALAAFSSPEPEVDAFVQPEVVETSVGPRGTGLLPEVDYHYFKPLTAAADEYNRFALDRTSRVYTGIPEFDAAMRGMAAGELVLVTGFAHSGKTLWTTEVILNNRDKRICFFSPDETRVLVLVKLACLVHGLSAEELEDRLFHKDPEAKRLLYDTAAQEFPNLAVFEEGLTVPQMNKAIIECEATWGAPAQLRVFDYVDLLSGGGEDTVGKLNTIKAWSKSHPSPLIALHQSSRTAGKNGQEVTIDSGGYGGEQQAIFLVGVRRKRSEIWARIKDLKEKIRTSTKDTSGLQIALEEAEHELMRHQNTVTFNLVKNKRPPGRLIKDLDFYLDEGTGKITPLETDIGVPSTYRPTQGGTPAQRARQLQAAQTTIPVYDDDEPF